MNKCIGLLLALLFSTVLTWSQDLIGLWYNDVKDAKIEVYKAANGKFYGKIVWLKEPNRDGKSKVDKFNTNKKSQTRPIIGLVILSGLEQKGTAFENGTIYDPKSGKTYSCTVKNNGKDKLSIRGFVGISMLGKTSTWTRVSD